MQDKNLWEVCLISFEKILSPQQLKAWMLPLRLIKDGDDFIITAPNTFTLKLVQERFFSEITKQSLLIYKTLPNFSFKVQEVEFSDIPSPPQKPLLQTPAKLKVETSFRSYGKLNPSLTFENFVIGKANQLAFAAATQVSELPGVSYNPLFIYGGVGLGKTHLAQAIGNQIKVQRPDAKICYMHAERYVADVVRAYETKKF